MKNGVKPIPEGHHTITPHLVVRGADQAIAFYKRALGAQELCRSPGPDGKSIIHAELKIGDSVLFVCDEFPEMGSRSPQSLGGTAVTINLRVEDVDAAFQRVVEAGGKATMPPADMFWGDRYAKFIDPFGHSWAMATHKEDVSPEEVNRRAQAFFAQMGK